MQHFMIPCDFGGRKAPFPIYVGEPKPDSHPLHHQSWWLSSERGGSIPQEVMDSFEKLHKIAMENNVSFEELCVYAMGEAMGGEAVADAPPPPPEEVQYAEPQHVQAPPAPEPQPLQQQMAPQPVPQQGYAEQHAQHGTHQERVESYEQNPAEPSRNNQS